jgi:selenide,water dikinase
LAGLVTGNAGGLVSGIESRDDAGYVPFGGGLLLQSVDFFTPIVDDPYSFGQIAAANAFSDIYAMGGEPVTAMNLVAFPCSLDLGILREILAGGLSKIEESGARLCGGHSVQDDEPKYGLSVTGFVEEDHLTRNTGARPGDALILTKPLGTGILTTALKRDLLQESELEETVRWATRLNRGARDAAREVGVSAATDVTGYGLLGHLLEMLEASGAGAVVRRDNIPLLDRASSLAAEGSYPGGLKNNREYLQEKVRAEGVSSEDLLPLYDPQTSGGLLLSVPAERAGALERALQARGELAAAIGEITEGSGVRVVP